MHMHLPTEADGAENKMAVTKSQLKVATALTAVSFILILIVCVSPGRAVTRVRDHSINGNGTVYSNTFYTVYCPDDQPCQSYDKFAQYGNRDKSFKTRLAGYHVETILSVLLMGVSLVSLVWSLRSSLWIESLTALCSITHTMTVTLQCRDLVQSVVHTMFNKLTYESGMINIYIPWGDDISLDIVEILVPWGLILYGISMLITMATALYFTITLIFGCGDHNIIENQPEIPLYPQAGAPHQFNPPADQKP